MCSSTLSLTSAIDGMGVQRHALTDLPSTHCIGGWVRPRVGQDGWEKSQLPGIRSPNRSVVSHYND